MVESGGVDRIRIQPHVPGTGKQARSAQRDT